MKKIPLTLQQQDIYYDQLITPEAPNYNIGARVEIDGRINISVFTEACEAFVQQHDVFRYCISQGNGTVFFQEVAPTRKVLEVIDFSTTAAPKQQTNQFVKKHFTQPFNFSATAPLFYFALLKISETYFVFYSKYHHIITDGWGTSLVYQRLVTFYNEKLKYGAIKSVYTYSYKDYVKEDLAYEHSKDFLLDKEYWINRYKELPEPLFSKNTLSNTLSSKRKAIYLNRGHYNQLNLVAKQLKVSTFHVILGALYIYFSRFYNNNEFAIGLPVLNRNKAVFKKTVGLFMGMSALKITLDFEETLGSLVLKIRNQLRQDYRHQKFPLGKLIQGLSAFQERERLFNLTLSYEKHDYAYAFEETNCEVIPLTHQAERVALATYIREFDKNQDVKIDFDYNIDYFDEEAIEKFSLHFNTLLGSIVRNPNAKLYEFEFIEVIEKDRVTKHFNQTVVSYAQESIPALVNNCATAFPQKIALKDEVNAYNYEDLKKISDQIAHHLLTINTKKTTIAVLMDRSAEMVAILLGILKSGSAYIPLDPTFPIDRLQYIIQHSKVQILIYEGTYAEYLKLDQEVVLLDKSEVLKPCNKPITTIPEICNKATAYIIYTSGSTGNPKGVEISHKSVVNFLQSMQKRPGLSVQDVLFSVTTYSFDISVLEFFLPLITGATVYVASKKILEDPKQIITKLGEVTPSCLQATPSFYQMLYTLGWKGSKQLKVLCGGDVLSGSLSEKLVETNAEVWNMYGPTETTIWSTTKKIEKTTASNNIGTPIANTQIYILDQWLNPVSVGAIGNIYIGGEGLAKGYYQNQSMTQEKFISSPFNLKETIYQTGDVGKWNNHGEIEFLGRSDNQVKIRGYRIELGDIEQKLNEIDEINDAVVIAQKKDHQEAILVGFYISKTKVLPSNEISNQLRLKLPEYMVPRVWVPMKAFPLTPNKKVNRKLLKTTDISSYFEKDTITKKPVGETENELITIWQSVLDSPVTNTITNFFELGGHSLKAVELVESINQCFGTLLGMKFVFDYPTILEQSAFIKKSKRQHFIPIPKLEKQSLYDLAPVQEGLWWACQQSQKLLAYMMCETFKVTGHINKNRLEKSIQSLFYNHEILRSNFVMLEGTPKLKVAPKEEVIFTISEVTVTHPENIPILLLELTANPFDLEKELLLRVYIVNTEEAQFLVFITHHLIMDGHSIELFKRELIENYNTQNITISEKQLEAIAYTDFAHWSQLTEKNRSSILKEYWKHQLNDYKISPTFITDYEKPSFKGKIIDFELNRDLNSDLEALATSLKVSKFSVILATINAFINRRYQKQDFCIGVPVLGRNHPEVKKMLGMFVNTLPIRIQINGNENFKRICVKTNALISEALEHQEYSIQSISKAAQLSKVPFDSIVVYQNPEHDQKASINFNDFSLEAHSFDAKHQFSRQPIAFNFFESNEILCCKVEFDKGLFDEESIQLMKDRYLKFVAASLKSLEMPIHKIDIELAVEKRIKTPEINIDFNF